MVLEAIRQMTVAEYLAFEKGSEIKHEYIDGEIYPMPGSTLKHGDIIRNCFLALGNLLRSSQCRIYTSDMRVRISLTRYVYPDFSVVCNGVKTADNTTNILNPTLVAEVTSPSTSDYDRGLKREFYQSVDSLQIYLIIDQQRPLVELYTRQDTGWTLREFSGLGASLPLDTIGCQLPLAEIYHQVEF